MMPHGAWSPGEWPLDLVRIKCEKCQRMGQYRTQKLIQQHGADMTMPDLRHVLAECPRRNNHSDPCSVIFVDRIER